MQTGALAKHLGASHPTLSSKGLKDRKLYHADLTAGSQHYYLLVLATSAQLASNEAHEIANRQGIRPNGAEVRQAKTADLLRDDYIYVPDDIRDTRSVATKVAKSKVVEATVGDQKVPSILPADRY